MTDVREAPAGRVGAQLNVLAVDVGGTKLAAALVDGRMGERVIRPTPAGDATVWAALLHDSKV